LTVGQGEYTHVLPWCQYPIFREAQNLSPTAKPPEEVFLGRLEELVEKYGTQEAASGLAGVAAGSFSRWRKKRRKVNPDLSTIIRIADALGVPPGEMLTEPKDQPTRAEREKAMRQAIDAAITKARGELRASIVALVDRWAEKGE
jgi:transcriptional regulator with XRE-family HTH domain